MGHVCKQKICLWVTSVKHCKNDHAALLQQITNMNLNNSLLSDNDSSDNRQQTRVSAKIQQLLNTLKVKHIFFYNFVFGITLIYNN